MQAYGYPVIWLSTFLAAVGLPLPTALFLLAAGAFAALGDFQIVLLIVVTWSASVCGDNLGYWLGRRFGRPLLAWLERPHRVRLLSAKTLARGHEYFRARGVWAIFLTRFLFAALGGIVNLIAGAERYEYRRFLVCDISGDLINVLIPLLLGYIFEVSWEFVGEILGGVSFLALVLLIVVVLVVYLVGTIRKTQRARQETASQAVVVEAMTTRSVSNLPVVPRTSFDSGQNAADSLPL